MGKVKVFFFLLFFLHNFFFMYPESVPASFRRTEYEPHALGMRSLADERTCSISETRTSNAPSPLSPSRKCFQSSFVQIHAYTYVTRPQRAIQKFYGFMPNDFFYMLIFVFIPSINADLSKASNRRGQNTFTKICIFMIFAWTI